MQLKELTLTDYRNYQALQLSLHPMLNIFLGQNGQGKTNLLEAVYYLCYGKNFRSNKDRELIRWHQNYFRLEAIFEIENSAIQNHLTLYYDPLRHKAIHLNGVKYRRMALLPLRLRAVLFTPEDLAVVKGSPSERRHFIDRELEALYDDYEDIRHRYERALSQRNELLKNIRAKREAKSMLEPWNLQLVHYGVLMIRRRLDLLRQLVPQARKVHQFIVGGQMGFNVTYQSSLGQVLDLSEEALKWQFMQLIKENESEEIERGISLFGPHRDDLVFYHEGIDLRTYGSQGQQRTAILAMKTAVIDCYESRFDMKPLLLLDDVMSELDLSRQKAVMEIVVKKKIQTIITGTNIDFSFNNFGYNPLFFIEEGKIIR